jgi:Domain of unknown function (DUF4350)
MSFLASLDARDRKLLLICLSAVVVLAVITGFFARNQNRDDNPVPSSYLTGRHGARAAYDLLASSGYHIQRWEEPLTELSRQANAQTVVVLAEPFLTSTADFTAVDNLLSHGARVLVTGIVGGALIAGNVAQPSVQFQEPCKLTAQGLDPLADSGEVWMVPSAAWKLGNPRYRVDYTCAGAPAVVEFNRGAGHVIWWASSTPLENGSIARGNNLNLLLNALGPRDGHNFYWDESLHGDVRSSWYYARGPALTLLLAGAACIALLTLFSFSRRSGPLRELPPPARATPVEFLEALGSLYGKAGAAATAVALSYDRFRRRMGTLCGRKGMQMNAAELAAALRRRFPQAPAEMDADLAACEEAVSDDRLAPRRALALVQALSRHSDLLTALARTGINSNDWRNR